MFTPQAADERLLRVIERRATFANLPTPDFDLFEYGTADGKLLYPNLKTARNLRTYNRVDNDGGHIQLRYIPQQSDLGLQFVVQATDSGEWGFVTGVISLANMAGDNPNEYSVRRTSDLSCWKATNIGDSRL